MRVVAKKRELAKAKVISECKHCNGVGCSVCGKKTQFIELMADANIPTAYWFLKMSNFKGPENVRQAVKEYKENIDQNYLQGKGLCFTGQYGTGKTYSICALLKNALIRDYTAYYTSLLDVGHYMTNFKYSDKFYHLVTRCDFLAIDEVDSRHFSDSDDAQRYFGSNLERIVRYRAQNNLPILIGTNNASLKEVFTGQYSRVIDSLLNQAAAVVPALGKDYRKK